MMQNIWSGKNRTLVVFAVAVIIAGIASFWTLNLLKGKASAQAKKVETVPVAVAVADLPWGTVVTKEMIKMAPYLRDSIPAGYFSDPAALAGRTVIYPVKANEPILASRMAPSDVKGGGVAAIVAPNKRAMAVKVDKVVGVSGFIHTGNRVDVLVTLAGQGKVDAPITKTVLENVLVLAAGVETDPSKKQEKAAPVDVITLEVSPEEGEKLALAATEGKLQLMLRNFADTEDVKTKGTTIPVLLSSYSGALPDTKASAGTKNITTRRSATKVAANYGGHTVEIVQGNNVDKLRFGKGE
jgi:pilus assembly protein CpaB